MEMSGWETKKQPGRYDDDRFYPSLIMTEGQLQPSQLHPAGKGGDNAGCFHLTRSQLLERLAAPNIRTDRFNHPLLFARSDTAWEAPQIGRDGMHIGIRSPRWGDNDEVETRSFEAAQDDFSLPRTATVGGILCLTRSLLAQNPFIRKLSMTGFLDRAVCGSRIPPELPMLRSLSLGPPSGIWTWIPSLRVSETALGSVERLRICGHHLSKQEAVAIFACLPRLRLFEWTQTTATPVSPPST